VETKGDGHPRFTIKPLEDQLPFDKVRHRPPRRLGSRLSPPGAAS
jgi:hypothetical protein